MATHQIISYKIAISHNQLGALREIELYAGQGSSSRKVARVQFIENAPYREVRWPQPPNIMDAIKVTWPATMFAETIDLLRNEKPIYFWESRTINSVGLRTYLEPSGEEES